MRREQIEISSKKLVLSSINVAFPMRPSRSHTTSDLQIRFSRCVTESFIFLGSRVQLNLS